MIVVSHDDRGRVVLRTVVTLIEDNEADLRQRMIEVNSIFVNARPSRETHLIERPVSVIAKVEENLRRHDPDVASFDLLDPPLTFPVVDTI
jgi:hypothetical protein